MPGDPYEIEGKNYDIVNEETMDRKNNLPEVGARTLGPLKDNH